MHSFSFIGRLLARRARYKGYLAIQKELANLTEADLADMGAKRYQMGRAARVRAFK